MMANRAVINTEDFLNFLKSHQITSLKTIGRLSDDLLIHNLDVDLRRIFKYCQDCENCPKSNNDFRDWTHQDVLAWLKKND